MVRYVTVALRKTVCTMAHPHHKTTKSAKNANDKSKSNPYLDEDLIKTIQSTRKTTDTAATAHSELVPHSVPSLPGLDHLDESHENNDLTAHIASLHNHLASPLKFQDTHEPITLNIGGMKYQTTLTTLSKYKQCLLYKMFEGIFSNKPNKDGSYFIDRNGKYFEYILDYLRNGKLNIPITDKDSYLINHLLSEADYYQIEPLIQELRFLKIGTRLLTRKNLEQIQSWVIEEFPQRTHQKFMWKLLYEWNCDDITLKNPYNVMHAKCEGISSILVVLLCGNRVFGAYTSVKWKAKDVNDSESFVYWLGKEVIANNIYNDEETVMFSETKEESHSLQTHTCTHTKHKKTKIKDNGDRKFKFSYDSYREFKSYDSNSSTHRCMKFCGGYNDVVVCRYRAAKHQYGHFSIYTNETGYTVTASGPLSLDNSMHLQRMEIFHI
eukprot:22791_1